jgi:hypothetical protein
VVHQLDRPGRAVAAVRSRIWARGAAGGRPPKRAGNADEPRPRAASYAPGLGRPRPKRQARSGSGVVGVLDQLVSERSSTAKVLQGPGDRLEVIEASAVVDVVSSGAHHRLHRASSAPGAPRFTADVSPETVAAPSRLGEAAMAETRRGVRPRRAVQERHRGPRSASAPMSSSSRSSIHQRGVHSQRRSDARLVNVAVSVCVRQSNNRPLARRLSRRGQRLDVRVRPHGHFTQRFDEDILA